LALVHVDWVAGNAFRCVANQPPCGRKDVAVDANHLAPGEIIRVDTGCIVAFQPTVDYDIQYVGKIKSALFGGEGLFFATSRPAARSDTRNLRNNQKPALRAGRCEPLPSPGRTVSRSVVLVPGCPGAQPQSNQIRTGLRPFSMI
jgi:hypothetical protein